jgi:hypothetical protein
MIATLREAVWLWALDFGPVVEWPAKLKASLQEAQVAGSVDKWVEDRRFMLGIGRGILTDLWGLARMPCPLQQSELQDLWRQAFEICMIVQGGVACLQAWIDAAQYNA